MPSRANSLAGLPLDYLIGAEGPQRGQEGRVTETPYGEGPASLGPSIAYCNLRREDGEPDDYGPYLPHDDIYREYHEGRPDPAGPGFARNIVEQIDRCRELGHAFVEQDNPDSFPLTAVMRAIDLSQERGLSVIAKNATLMKGGALTYVEHPNVFGVIVEKDCGTPTEMDDLRKSASKPDLPVWFVSYADGLEWAARTAQQIQASGYRNMGVTYSKEGEYMSSMDILAPVSAAATLASRSQPIPQDPVPTPAPAAASINLLDPTAVATAALAHGAPWEKINGYKHLFYIEGCNLDGTPNPARFDKWHDVRGILEYVNGVPQISFKAEATTEPGKYYDAVHVIGWGGRGAALIDLGYQACWQVGIHHPGYAPHEALVQTGAAVNVWRDTAQNFTRGQGAIQSGYFGINHHSTGGADANSNTVGGWSAGCLVCPRMGTASHPGHLQYMASLKQDPRYQANNQFVFGVMVMPAQWVIDAAQGETQPQQQPTPTPVPSPAPVSIVSSGLVIDVAQDVTAQLSALKAAGVRTIIGYLTTSTSSAKLVRPSEARAIAAAGMRLGLVFEVWGGVNNFEHNDINATTGTQHGSFAKAYAPTLGSPHGAIIWFAIDTDVTAAQITNLVVPYFTSAKAALGGTYRIGAYACGAVCQALLDAGIIDAAWLAGAMGWNGSRAFAATNRWTLKQGLPQQLEGADADPDTVQPGADIGDFVPFATVQPAPPAPILVPVPQPAQPSMPLQSARVSWFSQYQGKYTWVDTGDAPNSNALGVPDYCQGIALPTRTNLGKWFELHAPDGIISIEQQTDVGPASWTGRSMDISAAAAERCGYSPHTFPTDSVFQFRSIPVPGAVANLSPQQQAITYYQMRSQTVIPPLVSQPRAEPQPSPPMSPPTSQPPTQPAPQPQPWPDPIVADLQRRVLQLESMVAALTKTVASPPPQIDLSTVQQNIAREVANAVSQTVRSLAGQIAPTTTSSSQPVALPGPGTPAQQQDQLKQLRDLLNALTGAAGQAPQPKLGQVNGALGQTIGNLLDGKKTAIGTIGAMLTALLAHVPANTGVGEVISQLTPAAGLSGYAMPVFLALAAWGALGKLEKWAQGTAPPPQAPK